jgi:hypothetical protein
VSAVRSAIPEPLRPAEPRASADGSIAAGSIEEAWRRHGRPLRRYVAARAHACWPLYQGARGLESQLVYLEAVLALAHVLAAEEVARTGASSDDPVISSAFDEAAALRESIRRADLWLVHLAAPGPLTLALDALLPPVR